VPWCDACNRFLTEPTLKPDGSCPTCGRVIAVPVSELPKTPWHFKLLMVALAIYLGYRLVQGIGWLL
jgi:hypothetical protein